MRRGAHLVARKSLEMPRDKNVKKKCKKKPPGRLINLSFVCCVCCLFTAGETAAYVLSKIFFASSPGKKRKERFCSKKGFEDSKMLNLV